MSANVQQCVNERIANQAIRSLSRVKIHETKKLIQKHFASFDDDVVVASKFELSILCPVGKTKLKTPCKSTHCQHIQCFDAGVYLMMNLEKIRPDWKCPICRIYAPITDLVIDQLLETICEGTLPSCEEVVFDTDCSWKPVSNNALGLPTSGSVPLVDLTLDTSRPTRMKRTYGTASKTKDLNQDDCVIDLTKDSPSPERRNQNTVTVRRYNFPGLQVTFSMKTP